MGQKFYVLPEKLATPRTLVLTYLHLISSKAQFEGLLYTDAVSLNNAYKAFGEVR